MPEQRVLPFTQLGGCNMCKFSDHAVNVITAKSYKGVGRAWVVRNMQSKIQPEDIVVALNSSVKGCMTTLSEFNSRKRLVAEQLMNLSSIADGVTAIGDDNFPTVRGDVKDSDRPIVLFYKGNIALLQKGSRNVSVIGMLTPDEKIQKEEELVVDELVKKGYCIVSGLALGCDSIAHRRTLQRKGKTVAILPSTLQTILPAQNTSLADEILQSCGLLVTEYMYDANSKQELFGRYQERDRLQALFADGIVLSASYAPNDKGLDSGSRLAMSYAKTYDVPMYAVYDEQADEDNPKYGLSKMLVDAGDAVPVQPNNVCDLIEAPELPRQSKQLFLF